MKFSKIVLSSLIFLSLNVQAEDQETSNDLKKWAIATAGTTTMAGLTVATEVQAAKVLISLSKLEAALVAEGATVASLPSAEALVANGMRLGGAVMVAGAAGFSIGNLVLEVDKKYFDEKGFSTLTDNVTDPFFSAVHKLGQNIMKQGSNSSK
jgi:hypothetical protein